VAGAVGGDAPPGLLLNENDDEDEDGDDSSTDTPFGSPRSTTPASSDDDGEIGTWAAPRTGDDYDEEIGRDTRPFRTREELYVALMLRSQAGFTESGYSILRAFYNPGRPADAHLPHAASVRTHISSRALQRFGLTRSVAPAGGLSCILPSVHARREFAFRATYDKFFRAGDSDELLREREPEFYDTSIFQDRRRVLMSCPKLTHFRLDGLDLCLGAFVDVCLLGNVVVHQA